MIQLLGIPVDANSSFLRGAAFAPARIRLMEQEGSANIFSEEAIEIKEGVAYVDCGDLQIPTGDPQTGFTVIKERVSKMTMNGDKIISLGGDHSISYPVIEGITQHYDNLHVLHLDAHADLYDHFQDNAFSHASPFARIMESGRVLSLTQVGIRTLSKHQREQAERFGVSVIEMKDFCMDFLGTLQGPLYISVDLDVLDPAFAPGVSHHEPGGMTTRQLISIIQGIKVPVIGADIVEYNPVRDINNVTAMVAYKLCKELIARMNAPLSV